MPISVVVGGQFGSEGKGKVALHTAVSREAAAVVRVGGPNSGHTAVDATGRHILRQLPTSALLQAPLAVLPPGAYIDVAVLLDEVGKHDMSDRLVIDPSATIVTESDRERERMEKLGEAIGSTQSGTGAAVVRRVWRGDLCQARDVKELRHWVQPTAPLLDDLLRKRARIVVEGTQGYGLSVLHGMYPFVTSRDTTAAAALSEAGLSPLDTDEVILVLRAFPIRVAGHSGPLAHETTWDHIRAAGHHDHAIEEYTSVTERLRRVAEFDARVVLEAITANRPTAVVLNHVDYVDHATCRFGSPTPATERFVVGVEGSLGRSIDWIGLGPSMLVPRHGEARGAVV